MSIRAALAVVMGIGAVIATDNERSHGTRTVALVFAIGAAIGIAVVP